MQEALIKYLKSQPLAKPSKINEPELAVFFTEPLLGPISGYDGGITHVGLSSTVAASDLTARREPLRAGVGTLATILVILPRSPSRWASSRPLKR